MKINDTHRIEGVLIKSMKRFSDERGWLSECFRKDEISEQYQPAMSYISITKPGVVRGPHEHFSQTDYFCFPGPSVFRLYLWDNRQGSRTYGEKVRIVVGENSPSIVVIPPGVVHAYHNIGDKDGMVLNYPNKLYAGWGKTKEIDEIRHEVRRNSPFNIDLYFDDAEVQRNL